MAQTIHFWIDPSHNIKTNKRPLKMIHLSALGTYWNEYGTTNITQHLHLRFIPNSKISHWMHCGIEKRVKCIPCTIHLFALFSIPQCIKFSCGFRGGTPSTCPSYFRRDKGTPPYFCRDRAPDCVWGRAPRCCRFSSLCPPIENSRNCSLNL